MLGIEFVTKSPFARMLAAIVVEYLIKLGFLSQGDYSQAVLDAIEIINFLAICATLLIWQWRAHHPAKTQLDVSIPITEENTKQAEKTKRSFLSALEVLLRRSVQKVVTTGKTPPTE